MSGETESNVSGWTTDTLHSHFQVQLEDLRTLLQERYETQTKAVEAAFNAQQIAMQTALSAAEKAVQTALLSAEKAVTKAELAADKRFESVNEFRGQLADQAATFLPRQEANVRLEALAERVTVNTQRLDLSQGKDKGQVGSTQNAQANSARVVSIISAVVAAASLILTASVLLSK